MVIRKLGFVPSKCEQVFARGIDMSDLAERKQKTSSQACAVAHMDENVPWTWPAAGEGGKVPTDLAGSTVSRKEKHTGILCFASM